MVKIRCNFLLEQPKNEWKPFCNQNMFTPLPIYFVQCEIVAVIEIYRCRSL